MAGLHTLDGVVVDAVPPQFALYPFGVFTTFVVVDGSVLGWEDHVRRLTAGTRSLWGHELDAAQLRTVVGAHAARLDGPASVRVTLYPEELSLAQPSDARGCRILTTSGPVRFPFVAESGFSVRTVEYERELPGTKSTALLSQIRLRREAQLAGFDDVLFRSGDLVLEGATWTIVCWTDDEMVTPRGPVLPSITVEHLREVAAGLGRRFSARDVRTAELARASLVLAVNANRPARAISAVDGRAVAVDQGLLSAVAAAYSALPRDPLIG